MNNKILIAFLNADNFEKLSTNQYMYDMSYTISDNTKSMNNMIEPAIITSSVLATVESKLCSKIHIAKIIIGANMMYNTMPPNERCDTK